MEIKIAVEDIKYTDLANFVPFQGNLKKLSDENYHKLARQIKATGFSAPIFAWHDENDTGNLYILDGHQRIDVLKRLQSEGFKIPPIPYVPIDADDYQQAKQRVLQYISVYGRVTEEGFKNFTFDINFSLDDFDIPEFEIPTPEEQVKSDITGSKELDENDFDDFDNCCPKCGFEWDDKK